MGKNNKSGKSDTELTTIRRLKLENQKLKKQMSKLRKQLSRIDIDRYSNLKDIIEAQAIEDDGFDAQVDLEALKEKWMCHECKQDYLRVIMVPRADGLFYIRKCASCKHRTKLKKYTDDVNGINFDGGVVAKLD
jgi:aspartyl/asparaginyl-tRNA synthetase